MKSEFLFTGIKAPEPPCECPVKPVGYSGEHVMLLDEKGRVVALKIAPLPREVRKP